MARLRRGSGESPDTEVRTASQRSQAQSTEESRTRTSPRKKAVKSYAGLCDSDEELPDCHAPIPRILTQPVQRSKQRRLAPLSALTSRTAGLELDLSTKLYGPPKRSIQLYQPQKKSRSPEENAEARSSPIAVLDEGGEAEEIEVEESVLCDSDASRTDSDDELPSPRKLFNLPRNNKTKTEPKKSSKLNLAETLEGLRITDSSESQPVPDRNATQTLPSWPTSSSDKENDHRAILRFSPPRLHGPRKQRSPERQQTPPPTSPSKGLLQSPSKTRTRVPTPPLRPSLDAFWNAETVNEWNDHYSPKKEWRSPKKLTFQDDDGYASPTQSPRKLQSPMKRTKAEMAAKKGWEARKHQIAEDFFAELDRTVTDGRVQQLAASTGGVRFVWSKTLNSTAGRANWKRETTKTRQMDGSTTVTHKHHASIELAEKVIDDEARLLNVVAHEFCHLCNFMVSGIKDQPHGKQFKEWGRLVTNAFCDRGVEVTTKHTYQIEYKYVWQCANEECGAEFKRHSKSIDTSRHTCGACRGRLVQIKPVPRKTAEGGAKAGGYAAFVKEHFKGVKKAMPGASQKEVMEAVGRKYREWKAAKGGELSSNATAAKPEKLSLSSSSDGLELVRSGAPPAGRAGVSEVDKVARVLEFIVLDD